MSYIRPARKDELAAWFVNNPVGVSFTEDEAEILAAALVAHWDLVGVFNTAT